MSFYNYYQQQPGWGTSAYQPNPLPTTPYIRPQAGWGGQQFYRAQLGNSFDDGYDDYDDGGGLFDSIWRGGRNSFNNGLELEEARTWHRRIYGGMVPLTQLSPSQLGAAAGYEAFRQWSAYGSTYRSPLGSSVDREKEALAGIAAGEATKLIMSIMYGQRHQIMRDAAQIAVATAYRLMEDQYGDDYDGYGSPYENRLGGYGGGYGRGPMPRRRSTSFTYGDGVGLSGRLGIPSSPYVGGSLSAQATGLPYVGSSVTGASYVSAQPTGVVYAQQQPQYVTSTGQPVQYVQAGVSGQPQYVQAGQQQYVQAGVPGQVYTTGYSTAGYQQPYATTGTSQVYYAQQPRYF